MTVPTDLRSRLLATAIQRCADRGCEDEEAGAHGETCHAEYRDRFKAYCDPCLMSALIQQVEAAAALPPAPPVSEGTPTEDRCRCGHLLSEHGITECGICDCARFTFPEERPSHRAMIERLESRPGYLNGYDREHEADQRHAYMVGFADATCAASTPPPEWTGATPPKGFRRSFKIETPLQSVGTLNTVYPSVSSAESPAETPAPPQDCPVTKAIEALIARWRHEFTERRQKEMVDDEGWLTGTGMLHDLTNDLETTFQKARGEAASAPAPQPQQQVDPAGRWIGPDHVEMWMETPSGHPEGAVPPDDTKT